MFLETVKNKALSLYLTGRNAVIDHSPQILLVGGIVAIGVGVYEACNSTLKIDEVLEEHKRQINEVESAFRNDEHDEALEASKEAFNYDEKAAARDKAMIYGRTVGRLFKLYYKSIILLVGGVGMIIASHNILNGRLTGAIAAYNALRSQVENSENKPSGIEKEGEIQNLPEDSRDESKLYSSYGFFYRGEHGDNAYDALNRLLLMQNWCRSKLATSGRLTANEVFDMVDADLTDEGMIVGWKIKHPDEANKLKFLINGHNIADERWRDYSDMFDHNKGIWVGLNVDGIVCDCATRKYKPSEYSAKRSMPALV